MNAEGGFESNAQERLAVGPVRHARAHARHAAHQCGPREQARAQSETALLPPDRIRADHQPREIKLEFVIVVGRVGALDVADLALEARIDDAVDFGFRNFARVVVMRLHGFEEVRETRSRD